MIHEVKQAMSPSEWDFANSILYKMCSEHPNHDPEKAFAKIWLIGRTYSAAIERRTDGTSYDDFYVEKVKPILAEHDIDSWFPALALYEEVTNENIEKIIFAHKLLVDIFHEISAQNKRSLASKYLHFHFPNLFYIYDSRAKSGIKIYQDQIGHVNRFSNVCDKEYELFFLKCHQLRKHIKNTYSLDLTPRQIDNLLLRSK
ncbi:TPA: hypothetical protein P0E33_005056 [Vibrio harveyi]|nr:hypothetical protein [Vibrio harveyi]HDM8183072.1 hypothetical protein [Vibrio harveyi]